MQKKKKLYKLSGEHFSFFGRLFVSDRVHIKKYTCICAVYTQPHRYIWIRCRFYHFSEFYVLHILSLSLRVSPALLFWYAVVRQTNKIWLNNFSFVFHFTVGCAFCVYNVHHVYTTHAKYFTTHMRCVFNVILGDDVYLYTVTKVYLVV